MVYRHILLGYLEIGPNDENLLTEAVKTKKYLIRIVTPGEYKTKEEAEMDDMVYDFRVYNETPFILGMPARMREELPGGEVPPDCPMVDLIRQEDWTQYRLIRLTEEPTKMRGLGIGKTPEDYMKPTGKDWAKLFPALGIYPIKKIARTIIALPEVEEEQEGAKTCRFL